jgi:hypothetical protein
VECGSNLLSGAAPDSILRCVAVALARKTPWTPPSEYLVPSVSDTILNILCSFH